MIFLPYSDDIRHIEEARTILELISSRLYCNLNTKVIGDLLQFQSDSNVEAPRATDDQIKKAAALIKRIDLKDFSVCQFANPGKLLYIGNVVP